MSHPNQGPEYFTLSSVDEYDGTVTILGIFENIEAVSYRLKVLHSSCGSEYRIECFHLQSEEHCNEQYNEVITSRNKYKEENKKKDELYQEYLNKNKRSEIKAIQEDIKLDKKHAELDALDDEWEYQRSDV